jgi:DNA polymerase-3 subunit beta
LGDIDVDCDVNLENSVLTCVHPTGNFTLPCLSADEFPQSVELGSDIVGDIELNLGVWCDAMSAVRFCVADETLRPTLNGVNVAFSDSGMTAVATDGNRLARYISASVVAEYGDFSFILPKKAIQSLLSLSSDAVVHLSLDNRVIVVECYDFKMVSRLIEGRYPNYRSVIPLSSELSVTFSKNTILTALRRVMPLGNNTSQLVTLSFTEGSLTIESRDDDFNKSGREFVSCDYAGESLTIGFKGSSLVDVFAGIGGDSVTMELTDASHACVIHGGNRDKYLSVLMPMLID